jgi:glycosyltransferase involved in cell wall biosynthesis
VLLSAAERVEGAAARAADRVVVCSPAFVEHFRRLDVPQERIEVVFNWADLDGIEPVPPADSERIRFLYAGNLGYTQGFETLLEAARLVGESVEVEIVGAGNAEEQLRRLAAATPNVRVRRPVPPGEFPGLLASAHVHLVLQRGVASNANFPSKIAAYMASARPIVASLEPGSAAAETLAASGAAVVVPPEDPAALAQAMTALRDDAARREALGERARTFARDRFAKEQTLLRLEQAITGRA